MLGISEASIISTSIEGLLYGFSIFMFMLTMWILLRNRERRRRNYEMIIAACSLQILATMEFTVDILRVCQGFLSIGPSLPGGPDQYFHDVARTPFVIKSCLYNIQTLILDGVVIYRTYVVWQRLYIIIIPCIGWCALLASSISTNIALGTAAKHADDVFAAETGRWITSMYATTLATNLSATALLAYRIWRVNSRVAKYKSGKLAPVLRVVIESGAIYSFTLTAALITFVIGSPGVYIVLNTISPIISIVFNMIIIRMAFASDRRLPGVASTVVQSTAAGRSGLQASERLRRDNPNSGYEMKSLTVEITRYLETDADSTSVAGMELEASQDEGEVFSVKSSLTPPV